MSDVLNSAGRACGELGKEKAPVSGAATPGGILGFMILDLRFTKGGGGGRLIIDHAGGFEDRPAAFEGVDGGIDEAEVAEFGGDFIGGGAIGGAENDDAFVFLGGFEHAAYGGIDLLLHGGAFANGEHAVLRQHEVVELKIALAAGINPHHAVLVAGAEGLQADAPLGQLALHTHRQAARRKEDGICPA